MESLACDIVLLPEPKVAALAIDVSRQLAALDTCYQLEDGKCFPHVSLYMTQLSRLDEAKSLLERVAGTHPVLDWRATRYYSKDRYFDAEYERSHEAVVLQETVIAAINPIRNGMRARDLERLATATGVELDNLKKYGYRGVGSEFRPHLSLTRFTREQTEAPRELAAIGSFSGRFDRIGLFEMGSNGTCVRKIAEFRLAG